jgi:hypothetical protein
MQVFELIRQRADRPAKVGAHARQLAFSVGVQVSYMEDAFDDRIVREYPDGRRELLGKAGEGPVTSIAPRG